MRKIDAVQLKIIESMKGCKLDPIEAINVLLSIALSIARETEEHPTQTIIKALESVYFWQQESQQI